MNLATKIPPLHKRKYEDKKLLETRKGTIMKEFLHAKLHNAQVTHTLKEYEGSIAIDKKLLKISGIWPYEKVIVADVENGVRFETYVIEGEEDSGIIAVNGSAANLVNEGDRVIVMAFSCPQIFAHHSVRKIIFGPNNEIKKVTSEFPFDDDDFKKEYKLK